MLRTIVTATVLCTFLVGCDDSGGSSVSGDALTTGDGARDGAAPGLDARPDIHQDDTAAPAQGLIATPAKVSFGSLSIGSLGDAVMVTITNAGTVATGALAVTPSGPDRADFVVTMDVCTGAVLTSAQTCTLRIAFAPRVAGEKSARLTISGQPGGSATVDLDGNAMDLRPDTGLPIAGLPDAGLMGGPSANLNTPVMGCSTAATVGEVETTLIKKKCADPAGCHGNSIFGDYKKPRVFERIFAQVPTTLCVDTGDLVVDPKTPDKSTFLTTADPKIDDPRCRDGSRPGDVMPPSPEPRLTEAEFACLRAYVLAITGR